MTGRSSTSWKTDTDTLTDTFLSVEGLAWLGLEGGVDGLNYTPQAQTTRLCTTPGLTLLSLLVQAGLVFVYTFTPLAPPPHHHHHPTPRTEAVQRTAATSLSSPLSNLNRRVKSDRVSEQKL